MSVNIKLTLWIMLLVFKIVSGVVLGFTLAVIIQTLSQAGVFSFVFITVVMATAFLKLTWRYKFFGLMVIDLLFVTLFFLFKLYVSISAA